MLTIARLPDTGSAGLSQNCEHIVDRHHQLVQLLNHRICIQVRKKYVRWIRYWQSRTTLLCKRALRRMFETAGFDITIAPDGTSAMDVFRTTLPRVVILDLRLPGRSGQDLCREIKRQAATVPILVLNAASDVVDKVLLLELGADDYVTKRFSPRELLARVRAAIPRLNQNPDKRETASFADVEVNFSKILRARVSENPNDLCYRLPVHRADTLSLSSSPCSRSISALNSRYEAHSLLTKLFPSP
jgi:CheY-like chemotaxis protein